ncbi:MAG: hypothetical protein ACLTKE_09745 [Coprococcus sp.]
MKSMMSKSELLSMIVLRLSTLVYEIEGTTIREVPKGTTVGTFKENLIHHKRVNVDAYKGDKR